MVSYILYKYKYKIGAMNINCSELRKDIDKTREAYDRLHEKTEEDKTEPESYYPEQG